jgi:DNA-binding transcriptional MerR regulator
MLFDEMPVAMTAEILRWWAPEALPPRVRRTLDLIGTHLSSGLTLTEIGEQLEQRRSGDWVATRLGEVRAAIAAQVLEVAGDELPAELRARLKQYVTR